MANLFGTHEAEAARRLFYFMADYVPRDGAPVTDADLRQAWIDARLGLSPSDLDSAIRMATESRRRLTDPEQKRWSEYSIQRVYLQFLDTAGIRDERVPDGRGEVVFYNLGKFSQVISDFESINYHSAPLDKYETFAAFLEYHAENAYPEGWQDSHYANPDAVRIMTVHQAKGMQWPVVFLPALIRNRFPAAGIGGKTVWHLLPSSAVVGQSRFDGSIEDERRLFYVAMTRSQKFLHLTWAPVAGSSRFSRASEFFDDVCSSKYVTRVSSDYSSRKRLPPTPRASAAHVEFSFSELKYFFECPYQFKLRVLYGFNAPIHEALGYGKSLHDALAEVHSRAIRGDIVADTEVPQLVARHLHVPYAYPRLREQLQASASRVLTDYLRKNGTTLRNLEYSEKQIEINLGDAVRVTGRIDLVRRLDTDQTSIVDLKSSHRTQPEEVTETQLHIYALGYRELTGCRPDFVEVHELEGGKLSRRTVDDDFIEDVTRRTRSAAQALRSNDLAPTPTRDKCSACDYVGMCTAGRNTLPFAAHQRAAGSGRAP
jgi:DNA helicase-2/ATP-dependent DNA helicase PcrA